MPGAALKPHWFYILLSLAEGARHGLAIARDVDALSDGQVRLWPATLYGSIDALCDRKLIEELSGPPGDSERKRYYRLTRTGRALLTAEADRMERLSRLARARVRPHPRGIG